MIIDCDRCVMRGIACPDCVVMALLGPPGAARIDAEEERALRVLADARMVSPLRLRAPVARAS
jgi:hypothetical protein